MKEGLTSNSDLANALDYFLQDYKYLTLLYQYWYYVKYVAM